MQRERREKPESVGRMNGRIAATVGLDNDPTTRAAASDLHLNETRKKENERKKEMGLESKRGKKKNESGGERKQTLSGEPLELIRRGQIDEEEDDEESEARDGEEEVLAVRVARQGSDERHS